MENKIETKFENEYIYIRTPGRYALGLAVDILNMVDQHTEFTVKNTGWKEGFGLKVCERIPIESDAFLAELATDGDELEIHYVSGARESFSILSNRIKVNLNEKIT